MSAASAAAHAHRTPLHPAPARFHVAVALFLLLCCARGVVGFFCDRSKWEARIDADLGGFEKTGITRDALAAALKQPCGGYLVSITRGKLYAFPLGWAKKNWPFPEKDNHHSLAMLTKMLCNYPGLPDVTFVINAYDRLCYTGWDGPVPTISWGKDTIGYDSQILMPYWTFHDLPYQLRDVNAGPPWELRKNTAVWRGTTTGGDFEAWNWRSFPRGRLVSICNNSRLCDAKFTGYPQATPAGEAAIRAAGGHGAPLNMSSLLQHKYMIVNDGNMAPSSRLFMFMHAGSVILKQESPSIEFYYDDLKPYQHYIPVAFNFGDIEQKIRWARHHDRRAKAIATNALAYARQYLTREHVECFMYRLLLRYARAQRFVAGYHNSSWQQIIETC